jgi:hypothetical protein
MPDMTGGSDTPQRRARGFQRAGGIVAPTLAAVAERRGFVEARLVTAWAEIAGPEIAAATRPVKMTRPRGPRGVAGGGTLTVEADGARAPEVQMMLPTLRARVNAALGYPAVARIQVVHGWGFAEAATPFVHPRRAEVVPEPEPEELAPLLSDCSSIGDGGLRAALETLARNVISRRSTSKNPGDPR